LIVYPVMQFLMRPLPKQPSLAEVDALVIIETDTESAQSLSQRSLL